jgi:hypothetical protein
MRPELGNLQFQSARTFDQLGLGVLAFGVQQFVDRFADDGNDGRLPFRAQRRSDQRLDVGDG